MSAPSPFWSRSVHEDRQAALRLRSKAARAIRAFFEAQEFLEVDTAILQVSPGNETHISAFETQFIDDTGAKHPFFLHSSPEFACKKLLAAGETRIFSLGHVFRNLERGPLHHPEFTMLEWYRADAPYDQLGRDCAALLKHVADKLGVKALAFRGIAADPMAEIEYLSVTEAFSRYAGIELLPTLEAGGRDLLAEAARAKNIRVAEDDTWSDLFSKILSQYVEPNLGHGRPTILDHYPAAEAALARLDETDPRFAQRFELYACGVELANGFGELTDAAEQRRRFEEAMAERQRIYGDRYPLDEDFLAALPHMPPACGIALGFDRLVMLLTGASHIEQVLWTPLAPTHETR